QKILSSFPHFLPGGAKLSRGRMVSSKRGIASPKTRRFPARTCLPLRPSLPPAGNMTTWRMSRMHPRCLTRLGPALALGALLASPACGLRAEAVKLPGGGSLEKVDFERHVMGVFGRMGCNSGSCHGSFQGKGGFRLSLFGYDPGRDYLALTRDANGRRVDR